MSKINEVHVGYWRARLEHEEHLVAFETKFWRFKGSEVSPGAIRQIPKFTPEH